MFEDRLGRSRMFPSFRSRLVLLAGIGLCLYGSAGRAEDLSWIQCQRARQQPDIGLIACTQVIAHGSPSLRAAAFHNRGTAYAAKNDLDHAIQDVSEGIRLDPSRAYRYEERGELLTLKGDADHAIADLTHAIALDPKYAFRFHSRSSAYKLKGDLVHALADESESIRIDSTHAFRFWERANLYRDLGQFDAALADYMVVIRLEPASTAVLVDRGLTFGRMGNLRQADIDLRAASEAEPTNAAVQTAVNKAKSELFPSVARNTNTAIGSAAPPFVANSAPLSPAALPGVRVALVIANGRYASVPKLPNPPKDGALVAETFRSASRRCRLATTCHEPR